MKSQWQCHTRPITRLFGLHFFALLTVWACTHHNKAKNRTVLMVDSTLVASFERSHLRLKYMSDEGVPNVQAIKSGLGKIVMDAHRQNIEMAFQSDNIVTQYFLIKPGDSVLLTEYEDNIGIKILNRPTLPFDENYRTKHRATLRMDAPGVDEFYGACALVNGTRSLYGEDDADLREDLLKLKKSALEAIPLENKFIDSLTRHNLISTETATFYQMKNAFDSIKVSTYQGSRPDSSTTTWLAPFKAVSHKATTLDLFWTRLTFYDDWLDAYIAQLASNRAIRGNSEKANDSLRGVIQRLVLKDSLVKDRLLLKVDGAKAPQVQ